MYLWLQKSIPNSNSETPNQIITKSDIYNPNHSKHLAGFNWP